MTWSTFSRLRRIFVEPSSRLSDVAQRHKSRLLNGFLLFFIAAFAGVDTFYLLLTPGYIPPWYGYLFLLTSYLLNRIGYFALASALTMAMFPIVIFANIVSGNSANPLITLYYLIPGLIFGSILLSMQLAVVFTLVGLGIILAMPYLMPQVFTGLPAILGPLSSLVLCGVLVVISMWMRDEIEKERQSKLRESEEQLRLALQSANMGTWNWDLKTEQIAWSAQIEPMFGLQPGEFNGKFETYLAFIHPADLADVQKAIEGVLTPGGGDFLVEHRIIDPAGHVRWVEGRGKVYRNSTGIPFRMAGTVVDITERKRAEQALRDAEEKYRNIVENSAHGIFQSTPEGEYLSANPAMARIYGYDSPEEFIESIERIPRQVYVDPAERLRFTQLLAEHEAISGFEARNLRKDGSVIWVSSNARAVKDDQGKILYYEGTVEDITDRKKASAERERLLDELSGKNAELERFVYTVSHDLKSPLVTIVGFLGFVEEDLKTGDVEALHRDMERIYRAAFKMQELLQDLLDLSRVGRVMNEPETISFSKLVEDAVELTEGRLQERGVQIHVQPDLPDVHGDAKRLLELVQNLIDNAAKYVGSQPEPRIEIGCSGTDGDKLVFFIRDNGSGIAPEHHEKIFGLFYKLDPNIEGTGVGLSLVRRIVEVHGGRIWVESEVGKGATFFFTLPPKED